MRLTENQLRRVIRSVIKENHDFFNKLIDLLSSERVSDINNGLQLAETMGYIGQCQYRKIESYSGAIDHKWEFDGDCDPAFLQALGVQPNSQRVVNLTPDTFVSTVKIGKTIRHGFYLTLKVPDSNGYVSF